MEDKARLTLKGERRMGRGTLKGERQMGGVEVEGGNGDWERMMLKGEWYNFRSMFT